jgi:hypothetical protein
MSRTVVLAVLAACSAPAATRITPVVPPAAPAAAPAPPAVPVVLRDPGDGGVEAPPAGAIRLVAATPQGDAALTTDDLHGVRLWPALDGSQEPRIVLLPEAHALALGRRGDGFTAAVLDAAGGLYIATLDAQGRIHSHVSLAADPEFLGISVASRGLVAWRADQSLELRDGDGAVLARLATEPGERIVALSVAGEHVAVLLERDGTRGVRTIALDKPTWGAWIDLGASTADLVAVAPSGRFAVRDGTTATVYDVSGKLLSHLLRATGEAMVLADDTHVAMSSGSMLLWLAASDTASKASATVNANIVAGGGRVISATNGDVALGTPADTHYLGYDVASPSVAQAIGTGQLAVGSLAKVVTLDAQLRVARAPTLPVRDRIVELRWLEGDTWAVESGTASNDEPDFRVIDAGKVRVVKDRLAAPSIFGYEPSTHVLTMSLGDTATVYRYNPATHDLAQLAVASEASTYFQTELIPLNPARAGAQLLRVTMGSDTTFEWIPDATKLDKPSAKVKLTGSLAGADPTGNVYAWVSTAAGMELATYRDGKRVASLPADGPVSVWPDPAGGRIVEIATKAVSLVTSDGKRQWTVAIDHPTTAVWLSDGGLAIVTAAGIARLDPATGKPTAVRCGFGFGLATAVHPTAPPVEPVCSQLEGGDE